MSLIGARGGVLGAAAAAVEPDYWEMTVETPTNNATWSVQVAAGTTPNLTIVWGDATSDTTANSVATFDHEYATAGTYTVRISGTFASGGRIRLGKAGNYAYLKAMQPVGGITNITSFQNSFTSCTGLTSIPADLFRWYSLLSQAFISTFQGCTGLTSVPADLFRYSPSVTSFYNGFQGCTGLTSVPAGLFRYNTSVTSFYGCFENCNKLQLRADLFFDTGEASTRFLNRSVNFTNAMRIGTFTGDQGTAPALWTCDFGTGTPTTTDCFTGHTTSSVTNHASIPTAWGGPA
jgi:hypothetical protein